MKHHVKLASLPYPYSYFDPEARGLISYLDPQEVAYRQVMGRPSPEPFPEGTIAHEQWTYRKDSRKRSVEDICHPKAKPTKVAKKAPARRRRKPVGA